MAINVADNFSYKGGKPLDARTKYASVADMVAVPVADLYDGCLAYVTATKKNYQYDSTNDTDPTLGKWRELSTGGGGGASSFSDLDDVSLSNVQNGQVPKYNSQTGKWENADESGGGSGGHVIEDNGTAMTQRDTMNMIGFDVEDDNSKTEISEHRLTSEEMTDIFDTLPSAPFQGITYSTTEQVVGRWIDGKPLYQKTVHLGVLPDTNRIAIQLFSDYSAQQVVDYKVISLRNVGDVDHGAQIVPYMGSDVQHSGEVFAYICGENAVQPFGATVIVVQTTSDRSNCNGYVTLQYTKTAD